LLHSTLESERENPDDHGIRQMVEQVQVKGLFRPGRVMGFESVAYFLATFGTVALLAATLQHLRSVGDHESLGESKLYDNEEVVAEVR
jgi:hypothetical protein